MSRLTDDQETLLAGVDYMTVRGLDDVAPEYRAAFAEAERLGLIKAVSQYETTPAGRAALASHRQENERHG